MHQLWMQNHNKHSATYEQQCKECKRDSAILVRPGQSVSYMMNVKENKEYQITMCKNNFICVD